MFAVGSLFAAHLCHHQCHFCLYEHTYDVRTLSSSSVCDLYSGYIIDVSLHSRDDSKNAHPGYCQGKTFHVIEIKNQNALKI